MTKIQNKVIWITGASSGIGEELAYQLSEKEARLILSARRMEELERVAENCRGKAQGKIKILPLDLSDADHLKISADAAIAFFGEVDILINNGGISQRSLAKDTSMEVYRRLMEVDYFGAVALTQYLLPHFIHRKNGHYVVVSSVVGKIGSPFRSGYAAAKHALHGYYDSLRAEIHDDNIRVSIICPGWVNTDVSKNALTGDGTKLGKTDRAQAEGMSVEYCAQKIVQAIEKNKDEIYLGGREKMAVYAFRFFPDLFRRILERRG